MFNYVFIVKACFWKMVPSTTDHMIRTTKFQISKISWTHLKSSFKKHPNPLHVATSAVYVIVISVAFFSSFFFLIHTLVTSHTSNVFFLAFFGFADRWLLFEWFFLSLRKQSLFFHTLSTHEFNKFNNNRSSKIDLVPSPLLIMKN